MTDQIDADILLSQQLEHAARFLRGVSDEDADACERAAERISIGLAGQRKAAPGGDGWHPMTEHLFPWDQERLIVVAFAKDEPKEIEIFRVQVAEHGAMFPENTTFLTLHEQGWIPFAWRIDDSPAREDARWPPLLYDYLTEPAP